MNVRNSKLVDLSFLMLKLSDDGVKTETAVTTIKS